ncbi:E3 ubiquitin-protein ligase synoviolin [Homalodisca vitripennis]|nr:E3 ubiquitin-protein ligase synoviolin [Homalodisca vitripennis]
MNTLYPDATPEELAAADNVCIICREEMVTGQSYTCYICTLYILMPHLRSLQLQTTSVSSVERKWSQELAAADTSVSSVERKWSQVSHILVKYEHLYPDAHLRSLQLQTTSVSSVERKWSQVSHILVTYEHSIS